MFKMANTEIKLELWGGKYRVSNEKKKIATEMRHLQEQPPSKILIINNNHPILISSVVLDSA